MVGEQRHPRRGVACRLLVPIGTAERVQATGRAGTGTERLQSRWQIWLDKGIKKRENILTTIGRKTTLLDVIRPGGYGQNLSAGKKVKT